MYVYRPMYIRTVGETLTHTGILCRCNNTWTWHHVKVTHTYSISSISWYTYHIQLLGNVQQQMCSTTASHSGIHSLLLVMYTDSLRHNVTYSNNLAVKHCIGRDIYVQKIYRVIYYQGVVEWRAGESKTKLSVSYIWPWVCDLMQKTINFMIYNYVFI